jgi:hypothetical protein
MEEFMIPVQPEDLLDEDVSTGLKVLREVVVVDRPSEAIAEAADSESTPGCLRVACITGR